VSWRLAQAGLLCKSKYMELTFFLYLVALPILHYVPSPNSLPSSPIQHRPRLIINFAKTQRQSFLKYLAILRWKNLVDVPSPATLPDASFSNATFQQVHSIPTPITNGSYGGSTDNSPAAGYIGKGKGRALTSDDDDRKKSALSQGRVTDAKRVQVLMEHQNRQHEMALHHITAALGQVESLRYVPWWNSYFESYADLQGTESRFTHRYIAAAERNVHSTTCVHHERLQTCQKAHKPNDPSNFTSLEPAPPVPAAMC